MMYIATLTEKTAFRAIANSGWTLMLEWTITLTLVAVNLLAFLSIYLWSTPERGPILMAILGGIWVFMLNLLTGFLSRRELSLSCPGHTRTRRSLFRFVFDLPSICARFASAHLVKDACRIQVPYVPCEYGRMGGFVQSMAPALEEVPSGCQGCPERFYMFLQ